MEMIKENQPNIANEFATLISEGFENPEGISGRVQISLIKDENIEVISLTISTEGLAITNEATSQPDATLSMPIATADYIIKHITYVDFRDPTIMSDIRFDGNLNLINHVAKALLRPSTDTKERFTSAQNLKANGYKIEDIPRTKNPSELEILEALAGGQPIIITDLKMRVPHTEWSLERIESEYGDVPLRVRSAEQKETVAEFISRVRSADLNDESIVEGHTKAYTEGCALPEAMHKDFMPTHFTRDDYIEPQIWLGSVPVNVPASSLHHDPMDGFLYQVMGRKKLIVYAPDQAPYLYPMKAYNNYQPCWVQPESPDFQTFPEFKKAQGIEVVLNPGELLVQPAGWFHAVYCLDSPTFSVSYFYRH